MAVKRLLQAVFLVVATSAHAATLNYNLGDYTLNPTNVLWSNLVSTAQITWSMGQSGRITGTITFPPGSDLWTNNGSYIHPVISTNFQVYSNGVLILTADTNRQTVLTNGGYAGSFVRGATATPFAEPGKGALALLYVDDDGGIGPELPSSAITIDGFNGGAISMATADGSTNCSVRSYWAALGAGLFDSATNCVIANCNGAAFAGLYAVLSSDCRFEDITDGSMAGTEMIFSQSNNWFCNDGSLLFGRTDRSVDIDAEVDNGALVLLHAFRSTNSPVESIDASILSVFLAHATNTGGFKVAAAHSGSLAAGIVQGAEKLWAFGSTNGAGAMSVGRDLASTNNWTFGLHYTNELPFSFAVGNNGVTQFRVLSNGNLTIKGLDYTMPSAHATGALTNDGSGTVGWFPLSSLSSAPSTNLDNLTVTNLTELKGLVGIGTNNPQAKLHVHGSNTNIVALMVNLPFDQNTNGFFINAPSNYPSAPFEIRWAETAGGGTKKISFAGGTSGSAQQMTLTMQDKTGFGNLITANGANVGHELRVLTANGNSISSAGTVGLGLSGGLLKLGANSGISVSAFNGDVHLGSSSGVLVISNGTAGGNVILNVKGQILGTNVIDGGWLRVVGEQTNDAGLTLSARTASSILRTDANKAVAEVIVGSGLSFDGTTLTASGSSASTNLDNLTVTNVTKLMGQTIATNIYDGGWLEVAGPQTNRGKVDIAGALTASQLQVTNETTHFGNVTNHASLRGTNVFNGGWLEVTGPQTNRDKVDIAGKVTASILQVTNETTHFGLVTNHNTMQVTNVFNGGWLHNSGNVTNGGTVRSTNGLVIPTAAGIKLGTGGTVTNWLFGSATLDFPSTGASAKADLSIAVTGAATGDECFIGVPAASAQVTGNFTCYSSNDTVWVRFFSGAAAQNPASGTFKATVWKR